MKTILAVDDLRDMPWCSEVARTSEAGISLLERYRECHIDELWLDHDLGGDDTVMNVVTVLEEAAFYGRPFDVDAIIVHSANPSGAATVIRALQRWGYNTRRVTAPTSISTA